MTDKNDSSSFYFGEIRPYPTKRQTRNRNIQILLREDSIVYAISNSDPIIFSYNIKNNNLIEKYDFREIQLIKKEVKRIIAKNLKENQYYVMFEDAYISNKKLYLLMNRVDLVYKANLVLEFDLDPNLSIKKIHELPSNNYSSLCVDNNILYTFNLSENIIEKFNLYE